MNELPESNGLSERELEVLHLVATGASNKEIAQALSISQNTVKVHVRNIFSKTGSASRTEAAMYAVRVGLVETTAPGGAPASTTAGPYSSRSESTAAGNFPFQPGIWASPWVRIGLPLVVVVLAILAGFGLLNRPTPATISPTIVPANAQPRWQQEAGLPMARSGLALAVYENQIYAIAGRSDQGIVGNLTRYQLASDTWEPLTEKPAPVTDVGAAVVGGRIYVPGGLQDDEAVTDILEIYEPRLGTWEQGTPMPVPLSAYSLVAFEGRLYVFGGWDGDRYVADVYVYDPDLDEWREGSPLPTARGFAGAAVVGDRIYVIGGKDEEGPLSVNEEYAPDLEGSGDSPWRTLAAMPAGRFGLGVAGIANVVHVFGGEGATDDQAPLKYFPGTDTWQPFEQLDDTPWSFMGMVVAETDIHVLGGLKNNIPVGDHRTYQAIFTIAIPVVPLP
jgi:DNA-binding CsgD family transcriptional regulator/N-acetylneuraminic acid mutarotase